MKLAHRVPLMGALCLAASALPAPHAGHVTMHQELGVSAKFADFMQQGLDSVELTTAVQVSFTGLAQIVRLGAVF